MARRAERLGQHRLVAALQALGIALDLIAQSRIALALSLCLHVASFLAHAAELWLTLYLMGAATGPAQAVTAGEPEPCGTQRRVPDPERLGRAGGDARRLGRHRRIIPDTALALGLVKRAREFAIGLPGLAAWWLAERRHPVRLPG